MCTYKCLVYSPAGDKFDYLVALETLLNEQAKNGWKLDFQTRLTDGERPKLLLTFRK